MPNSKFQVEKDFDAIFDDVFYQKLTQGAFSLSIQRKIFVDLDSTQRVELVYFYLFLGIIGLKKEGESFVL